MSTPEQTFLKAFAEKLIENPNFLAEKEEGAARDLLLDYTSGRISAPEDIEYIESQLKTNPLFQKIKDEYDESDAYLETTEGKAWSNGLVASVLKNLSTES